MLYFVLDKDPVYEVRTNPFRGTKDIANTNIFDLKTRLRQGRTGYLHGSDSIQESFDNLEALTTYGRQGVPKSYWLRWRPEFESVNRFFEHLNKQACMEYVVMRNFDSLAENMIEDGADIDILVNDYYLFKRATGAVGYKHKRTSRPSPAHEYGGYKVAGRVSIGGKEVSVDIRFIGDSYYCENWERNLLKGRVKHGRFFIPDQENYFSSLLYHALVHKRSVSDRYRELLGGLARDAGLNGDLAKSDQRLWDWLDQFMARNNYEYVRPNELSIQLSSAARKRIGINNVEDLEIAEKALEKGYLGKAMDLLLGVMAEEPDNRVARTLLLSAERRAKAPGSVERLLRFIALTRIGRIMPATIKRPIKKLLLMSK